MSGTLRLLIRRRGFDRRCGIHGDDLDHAVRANTASVAGGGDGNLRPVAYAELAHDLSDVDFHGRFRHSELAADHLVGVAQAETGENSVLPLGKFGSRPNAAGSIAEPEARRLAIEKGGGVLFVNAVVQPKGGRVMLLLCVRERVLLEHRGMAWP